nr:MAG TPA: hypothetical protein [Caudoviricetes sp.]
MRPTWTQRKIQGQIYTKTTSLADDYCTRLDIVDVLKEETGIDLEIRWNDKK